MNPRFEELIEKYLVASLGASEEAELIRLADERENLQQLEAIIEKDLREGSYIVEGDEQDEKVGQLIYNRVEQRMTTSKVRSLSQLAVAASILLAVGLGSYFLFFDKGKQKEIVKADNTITNDVQAPKVTKALITTADGKIITIDSLTSFSQGNVKIVKTVDGKIVYSGAASEVSYNTLTNPTGSKVIDMTLTDGSRVWLNAGSSVTYPVSFTANERKVKITGEAYFEVQHDANKPFIVSKGETSVQVLGTHFNVNAYDDEDNIKVTLLEGSVKVSTMYDVRGTMLRPGQQAQIATDIKVAGNVDLDEVMAWKNGLF